MARDVERGKRLAELRRTNGFTQQELADVIGVTQASISRIENGKHAMTDPVRTRIAEALELSPENVWSYDTLAGDNQ